MSHIFVQSSTQRIVVDEYQRVRVVAAGPVGPQGPSGTESSINDHIEADDPHGDRAYSDQADTDHVAAVDPHGDRAAAALDATTKADAAVTLARTLDASGFEGNLDAGDTTVQAVADKFDSFSPEGGGGIVDLDVIYKYAGDMGYDGSTSQASSGVGASGSNRVWAQRLGNTGDGYQVASQIIPDSWETFDVYMWMTASDTGTVELQSLYDEMYAPDGTVFNHTDKSSVANPLLVTFINAFAPHRFKIWENVDASDPLKRLFCTSLTRDYSDGTMAGSVGVILTEYRKVT